MERTQSEEYKKLAEDGAESFNELIEASMKMVEKLTKMPKEELTEVEEKFVEATIKTTMLLMMGSLCGKSKNGN